MSDAVCPSRCPIFYAMPPDDASRPAEPSRLPRPPVPRRTRPPRRAAPRRRAPGAEPFPDAFAYLDAWFDLLGPPYLENESAAALAAIPPFDERAARLAVVAARTDSSLSAGVTLPLEAFVRENGLDALDRLLLLALLRHAHDPIGDAGLAPIRLLRAVGADTLARRHAVLSRLEEGGALRDLAAVESRPDETLGARAYRLAPHLVDPLTTGCGRLDGRPDVPANPLESLAALQADVRSLDSALRTAPSETGGIWCGPAKGTPGWDHAAARRGRLARRLEAVSSCEPDPAGAEIRRLGLDPDERLAWAELLVDSDYENFGVRVVHVLSCAGCRTDPGAAAERILGPRSRLAAADALRFDRDSGPLPGRFVWMSRAARDRVLPWPRGRFERPPGADLDDAATPSRVGFDPGALPGLDTTVNRDAKR